MKEIELLREVIFAFQGLDGQIIQKDADGRFVIIKNYIADIDPTQRMLLEKLTSFGWLVNKIRSHINATRKDQSLGKVSHGLAVALNNELLLFYDLVSKIDIERQKCGHSTTLTLHQIHVQTLDHYFRLKTLAMLVECCKGLRGGELAKQVYKFMQQGDKNIRTIITRILSQIVLPIRQMLSQWIFHGEIHDPYDEFFIRDHVVEGLPLSLTSMSLSNAPYQNFNANRACQIFRVPLSSSMSSLSSNSVDDRQYVINNDMMPGFISKQQANKILAIGRAIHLLRKVCADSVASSVPGYDDLKKSFESTNIESLFSSKSLANFGEEDEFENLLNTAYKEVSKKALELLFGNFKLRSHFRGLRQYLLLGQGDFIRHLMDLLKDELDKPASECRFHNILSVLESAMRSTNAQFDEPDVTCRLDCRLLDTAVPNATGWDIFSLVYKIDGPISAVFTDEKMRDYIEIFRQLWRVKRVEHVLTSLWSSQMSYTKNYATEMPILGTVFHRSNILLTDMIHFTQHFQNFIMFEVVECSWVELVAATEVAKDVDDIIAAHDTYLRKIKEGTMCQRDTPFECILELQHIMTSLFIDIDNNLKSWSEIEKMRNLSACQNKIVTLAKKFQSNRQISR